MQRYYRYSQESPAGPQDEDSSPDDVLLEKVPQIWHRQSFWRGHVRAICIHSIVFFLYLTTIATLISWNLRLHARLRRSLLVSPANEVVEWEVGEWHSGDGLHEPYVGYPRPELEEAWAGLLGSTFYRLRGNLMVLTFARSKT
ncbi:hypothetical protein FGG08_003920 [Glutinoglossum americanum]|uniref:Uncharacterized protein n=1 Tax=Glutinoglossum americanum TaxID=1670608 RepID=A0A9P8HXD6_9PEZI|nr:hypothetical protein FGG08_003920 [Glutinoglossum americanum]